MEQDIAYQYELLIRRAFDNCGRLGDPLRIANADTYDSFLMDNSIKKDVIFGISYALKRMITKVDHKFYSKTKELDRSIWGQSITVEDINEIIKRSHELMDEVSKSLPK